MSAPELSVLTRTHRPDLAVLGRVARALAGQTLDRGRWEWIVVDNASDPPVTASGDWTAGAAPRIVREERLGQAYAFFRGIAEVRAPVVVVVDDDNILDPDYLEAALDIMRAEPSLGVLGGRVRPLHLVDPPEWFRGLEGWLACRDPGGEELRGDWSAGRTAYPWFAPNGAGMVVRREVLLRHAEEASASPARSGLGRNGAQRFGANEDVDIGMVALGMGLAAGYSPRLGMDHAIPARRMDAEYIARLAHGAAASGYLLKRVHGVPAKPPVPTLLAPLHKLNAWRRHRAWRSLRHRIAWRYACGEIDGRTTRTLRAMGLADGVSHEAPSE